LLAAAICSKDGKVLLSRQFVEMSKSRIEGLIATFTKLIDSSKQHTFIETESVRYVYQPLERMYVLLITTKASNILEDLETLRLFARVIPEYARGSEISDVVENAFQLIFAFDEIIALGYRETVTLAQIRTYTEMDSHEERMFIAVRENQEKEAKDTMRKRAKELQQARIAAAKQGMSPTAALSNFTSGKSGYDPIPVQPTLDPRIDESISTPQDNFSSQQQSSVRRGMRLGGRSGKGEMDKLAGMLGVEGSAAPTAAVSDSAPLLSNVSGPPVDQGPIENLHVRFEEKLTVQAGRDGGLELMELAGVMMVRVTDESIRDSRILVDTQAAIAGTDRRPSASMQTHPNLDKKAFQVGKHCSNFPLLFTISRVCRPSVQVCFPFRPSHAPTTSWALAGRDRIIEQLTTVRPSIPTRSTVLHRRMVQGR
uniref:Coatomer subunit delta n=1 Tax=Schistocephalus solidus TaxID=70667 RepID=A0A183SA58_SCHSO